MDAALQMFVTESYHDNKADLFYESFDIFEDAQIENYDQGFLALLMEEGNLDKFYLTDQFEAMVITLLNHILADHNIKVNEDTPLSVLNQFCVGLMAIEFYLDTEEILRTIESDLDTEEKLAQILGYVCTVPEDLGITYIEEVNPSLLDKILELFNERSSLSQVDVEEESKQKVLITKVKDLVRFFQKDDFIGTKLLNAGVLIGCDFNEYSKYFNHLLDDLSNEDVAKELLILFTMSKDASDSPLFTYTKVSALLFTDLDKITKVYSQISKIMLEFDRYMIQRSHAIKENTGVVVK